MCKDVNILSRRVKQFVKEVKQVEFAQQFRESSVEVSAFVNRDKNIFEVSFPDLKYSSCLKRKSATFHISALVCGKELNRDEILKWRVFMFSFNGNDGILHSPQFCNVPGGRSDTEVTMTVFYAPGDGTALEMPGFYSKRKQTKELAQDKLLQHNLTLIPKQEAIPVNGSKIYRSRTHHALKIYKQRIRVQAKNTESAWKTAVGFVLVWLRQIIARLHSRHPATV